MLIPRYGIVGAATAALLSRFATAYLAHLFRQHTRLIFVMHTRALLFLRPLRAVGRTLWPASRG